MRKYSYNLKTSVSIFLVVIFVLPFVFFYKLSKVQNDFMIMYDGRDAFFACLILVPMLFSIGYCRALARLCAKDLDGVDVTMASTRNAGFILSACLVVSGVCCLLNNLG